MTAVDETTSCGKTRPESGVSFTNLGSRYLRTKQYSITALTDSSGAIKERYAYDAYGGVSVFDGSGVNRSGTAEGNRYCYTGREWDDELGLYHYRARMYDSLCGRFLSRDPLKYADGFGLHANTFGTDKADPFGLFAKLVGPPRPGCGSISLSWDISAGPGIYWVAQKICFSVNEVRCSGESKACCKAYHRNTCKVCFYEMLVDRSQPGYEKGDAIDDWAVDLRQYEGDCGTKGSIRISTERRYYRQKLDGTSLDIGNKTGPKNFYECGNLASIRGSADSSQTEPAWWGSNVATIGSEHNSVLLKWNCCVPDPELIVRNF